MVSDLVSIIMLSCNDGRYVEETVRSVLAQTYQNWELLFVAEQNDNALKIVLDLRNEEGERIKKQGGEWSDYSSVNSKINVSYISGETEVTPRRNSALKDAKGRWIAFLDVGDIWEPTKLERQIVFMKEHSYAFSYTKYGLIDGKSCDRGVEIGGKGHVTYQDMMKCCWPAYLTVMYDAEKIGKIQVENLKDNNDYALWLQVSQKADCHLLDEDLAKMRTPWGMMGKLLLTNKIKWRYEVYKEELHLNSFISGLMTLRNMWYGLVKWGGHVSRNKNA